MLDGLNRQTVEKTGTLVGSWQRFGTEGPVSEIIAIGIASLEGEPAFLTRVVGSSEELDYPVAKAFADPKEH